MSGGDERPVAAVRRLANGYQVSQAVHAAAVLGIADLLAHGPRTSVELAESAGAHEPSLYRLLRALASIGVFREEDGRRFASTPLGDALRSDVEGSVAGWAAYVGRPPHWRAWGDLLHTVRTGENAFEHLYGTDVWSYRAGDPDENAAFDRAMSSLTRAVHRALLEGVDFGRFGTVVDVGGGNGALLAGLLAANPAVRGVLFDQPHVVEDAGAELEAAGVAERSEIVAGSFFDGVPSGGDAYLLSRVLHDWEDADALRILESCRRASAPGASVLVLERELGPPNETPMAKFSDLNMLVGPGGTERTADEFASLLASAGFRFSGTTRTAAELNVFEGVAE